MISASKSSRMCVGVFNAGFWSTTMELRLRSTCREICHILKATRKDEFTSQHTEYVVLLLVCRQGFG